MRAHDSRLYMARPQTGIVVSMGKVPRSGSNVGGFPWTSRGLYLSPAPAARRLIPEKCHRTSRGHHQRQKCAFIFFSDGTIQERPDDSGAWPGRRLSERTTIRHPRRIKIALPQAPAKTRYGKFAQNARWPPTPDMVETPQRARWVARRPSSFWMNRWFAAVSTT